jgi:hypothetical protein
VALRAAERDGVACVDWKDLCVAVGAVGVHLVEGSGFVVGGFVVWGVRV